MKSRSILILTGLTLSLNSFAQLKSADTPTDGKVPTQSEVAKHGARHYFPRLVKSGPSNFSALLGLNAFPKYLKQAEASPVDSEFDIFAANSDRLRPKKEWSLPFYNDRQGMEKIIEVEYGLCAGFSVALRKLNMMAFFDPNNEEKQIVPQKGTPAYFEFYKAKIDAIMSNKMTVIPNFANTYQLTSDPQIQFYVRQVVVQQWEITNINIVQGTMGGIMAVKQKPEIKQLQKVREHLARRVAVGFNPIVYLSKYNEGFLNSKQYSELMGEQWKAYFSQFSLKKDKGDKMTLAEARKAFKDKWDADMEAHWIHVLQIYEVSDLAADGSFSAKAWDINKKAQTAATRIDVAADGSIKMGTDYSVEGEIIRYNGTEYPYSESLLESIKEDATDLNAIVPLKWDDLEIESMIKENKQFCQKHNCRQKPVPAAPNTSPVATVIHP